jgi:hypothetical protein
MPKFVEKKMRPVEVKAYCECGGELRPTGTSRLMSPPQYPHVCTKCTLVYAFTKIYPTIEYREAELDCDFDCSYCSEDEEL